MEKTQNTNLHGPTLYLITGHTGAGKSTVAKKMAAEMPAFYLSHDELLVKAYGDNIDQLDFGDCCERMDQLIWKQAQQIFDLGINLVLEGYGTKEMRDGVRNEAETIGFDYRLVWIDCPADIRLERVRQRNESLNDEGFFISDEDFFRMEEANETIEAAEHAIVIPNASSADLSKLLKP